MRHYAWPGNIRELRNIIERCALLASDGLIKVDDLPPEIAASTTAVTTSVAGDGADSQLATNERTLIQRALDSTNWNQSAAARALGVTRDHLRYRIKKHGLQRPRLG
jgi:transcriptional regulator of acetoin/glycerol metabolism